MRLKQCFLAFTGLILLHFAWGAMAIAQEHPYWGPALSFTNGTFIQTGIGTIPAGVAGMSLPNTWVATTASTKSEEGVFRRILKLSDGRAIIYEIAVKRLNEGKQFEVTLKSCVPTPEDAQYMEIDPGRVEMKFLENYPTPLTINDGDMLALDVLVNPRTGAKLVDYFRISSRPRAVRSRIGDLSTTARSIEIGDVEFFVENFELRLNGKPIYSSKGGMSGRFIWLDVPQIGRFIFSLTPLSEVDGFYRSAYLTRQQIVFNHGRDEYELISGRRIIPASGVFYLWVHFDPTFTFPALKYPQTGTHFSIGAAGSLPLPQRRQ